VPGGDSRHNPDKLIERADVKWRAMNEAQGRSA
jgi:hypothetical protein